MEKHTKEYAEKLANEYAENKSSADVFKQSHSTDFLNGYLKAVEETNVKELRESVEELIKQLKNEHLSEYAEGYIETVESELKKNNALNKTKS